MQIIFSSISSLFHHFGRHKRTETRLEYEGFDGERKLFFADSIRPDSSSKRFPNFSSLHPSRFKVTRIKSKIFLSFFLDRLPFKGQTVAKNIGRIPASSSIQTWPSPVLLSLQLNERGLIYIPTIHMKNHQPRFFPSYKHYWRPPFFLRVFSFFFVASLSNCDFQSRFWSRFSNIFDVWGKRECFENYDLNQCSNEKDLWSFQVLRETTIFLLASLSNFAILDHVWLIFSRFVLWIGNHCFIERD